MVRLPLKRLPLKRTMVRLPLRSPLKRTMVRMPQSRSISISLAPVKPTLTLMSTVLMMKKKTPRVMMPKKVTRRAETLRSLEAQDVELELPQPRPRTSMETMLQFASISTSRLFRRLMRKPPMTLLSAMMRQMLRKETSLMMLRPQLMEKETPPPMLALTPELMPLTPVLMPLKKDQSKEKLSSKRKKLSSKKKPSSKKKKLSSKKKPSSSPQRSRLSRKSSLKLILPTTFETLSKESPESDYLDKYDSLDWDHCRLNK